MSLRFLADECLVRPIVEGLRSVTPPVDIVTVQEAGIGGAGDPQVLAWAAEHDLVVVTHDADTMVAHAYRRVAAGQPMPGLVLVADGVPVGQATEDLLLLACSTREGELTNRVEYVPLHR